MSTIRVSITEINSPQLAGWPGANAESQTWLQVVDLPNKPLFRWNGSMWVPVTGSVVLAQSAVAVSCPVDATEDILATINVPAGLLGPNGLLRVSYLASFTNNANVKTWRVRLGGIGGTGLKTIALANNTTYQDSLWLANRGAANSQVSGISTGSTFSIGSNGVITAAIDTSLATTLVITGQKATAGDTLTLESYLVEAFPG